MMLLAAEDLFRFYHVGDTEIRALKGISLMVESGEIVALTGPSGSGKSTLLSCLCGLDEPDGGTVDIEGRRMTRRSEVEKAAIRSSSLGILAQRDNLFAHLTVAENVQFALSVRRQGDGMRVADLFASVGLSDRAHAYPSTLSGGELARAGLATALALDAPLVVADEPTAEVDERTERMILNLLAERSRRGKGALIATHSAAVESIATRVLHLLDGRLVEKSPVQPKIVRHAAFELLARPPSRHELRNDRQMLIEARRLSRVFDLGGLSVHAVEHADIAVRQHDRIAVTGPSGSGKSTLLRMLAGLLRPSSGLLSWFGRQTTEGLRPSHISVVFQEPSLIPSLTVRENVALPLQLAGLPLPDRPHMTADDALRLLSLSDMSGKLPDELSGGQMQRVAFARALVTNPQIILADEPTGQLDRPTGRGVMEAVLDALDRSDTALLLTTHDERLAETMTIRFSMDHGRLAEAA